MNSLWKESDARDFVASLDGHCPAELALRVYSARLLGADPDLVLAGGGNASLKGRFATAAGEDLDALFVKASGSGLERIGPDGFVPLDLARLRRLGALEELDDARLLAAHALFALRPGSPPPSIEALFHALVPARYVDHTHASALLALSDRRDGASAVREALGQDTAVVPYAKAGFPLCLAVQRALREHPGCTAVALEKHGLITWGQTARESYESMIRLVSRADAWLTRRRRVPAAAKASDTTGARAAWSAAAPMLRGLLTPPSGDEDRPFRRLVLRPLVTPEVLAFLERPDAKALALAPPLTPDHLVRAKALPCWFDGRLDPANPEASRPALEKAVEAYAAAYGAYVSRQAGRLPGLQPYDPLPRVLLMPGLGAACVGASAAQADDIRDITAQTLRVKALVADTGGAYEALAEDHLFDMEYASFQAAKMTSGGAKPLAGAVALVTGAAGAIGTGVSEALLAEGAHVAVSDLPGQALSGLEARLASAFPGRVLALPMDVTDEDAVRAGFAALAAHWGGLDLVVVNAGIAHVAPLTDLSAADFRRLERVNVEGTLFTLAASGRLFKAQGTGGDVVMVSTKNVFAPGAKFGAYSATKAAAHQLARIASLELAEQGVRVNMVSPDAVFGHGATRSGLWAAVGPDRMKARGLDEQGLEEYYRSRNLLKARVNAGHVARAVLWFARRETPTTGATLPVDGGLPDATPR